MSVMSYTKDLREEFWLQLNMIGITTELEVLC